MNLVERLNARFNNVIHDGLALVGAVVDPWLAKLERQAMSNALGRDFGLDYADGLAAAEAEEEVHEPGFASVRGNAPDPSPVSVGDTGPGAGMVPPPPPAPGPSKCTCPTVECELLAEDICDEAEEDELLDEFMELGEFLDSATAEELAAMRQQREVSEEDLTMRIADLHGWSVPSIVDSRIARALLETYHITPR
ncbi:hypothetical protein I5H67_gp049 [Mycobacterium phage Moonbeam]|uniref:Uncharacterized protein n=2 Tax=Cheoctovirus TaxID=1623281 RepID=A0A249XMG8_9CAUD|nr:hypothetical protein I5H33_gp053 [Mycobacterium phage Emma]YP_009960115.1 hypothetical protein I5H67_gp049 [Mycobacterium phage Moonbeam]ASZ72932.1 hypothetical protein SEA_EMMA_53 [Mycobacterium phage Emma]QNN98730.1 hypothetical protein PBI_MOONBEAM_49 [Mycobacterium phage Moonbeam]